MLDTDMVCEHCEAKCVRLEYRRDGEFWNQSIDFECHYRFIFRGHDSRLMDRGVCRNSPEYLDREKKREVATEKLKESLAQMDVDEQFKSMVCSRLCPWA